MRLLELKLVCLGVSYHAYIFCDRRKLQLPRCKTEIRPAVKMKRPSIFIIKQTISSPLAVYPIASITTFLDISAVASNDVYLSGSLYCNSFRNVSLINRLLSGHLSQPRRPFHGAPRAAKLEQPTRHVAHNHNRRLRSFNSIAYRHYPRLDHVNSHGFHINVRWNAISRWNIHRRHHTLRSRSGLLRIHQHRQRSRLCPLRSHDGEWREPQHESEMRDIHHARQSYHWIAYAGEGRRYVPSLCV